MRAFVAILLSVAFAPGTVFTPSLAQSLALPEDSVNPYAGKIVYLNKGYAAKLEETIKYFQQQEDDLNVARTRSVQKTPTFNWVSSSSEVSSIPALVTDALAIQRQSRKKQLVQLVIYNLPDRDCSAKASDGEFHLSDGGLEKYKAFIDSISKELLAVSAQQLDFVILLEPDSLGNVVTNLDVEKCANAASAYKESISYAIASLQLPNVAIYIDAAHGGWLGWDGNLAPAAQTFAEVLEGARNISANATVRGLSINVSNYNQYIAPIRENFTEYSNSWDEFHYVNSLAPHLEEAGYPAHFIVDQGRSGKAGIRTSWGQWCNVKGAGYGTRPTHDQGTLNNTYVDAIVWVKPGGDSDGTSDETAARFDAMCAGEVAHVPAPEAGAWFNEYAVNLVKNAEPPLDPTSF